jgi:hypothetical protein
MVVSVDGIFGKVKRNQNMRNGNIFLALLFFAQNPIIKKLWIIGKKDEHSTKCK